MRKIFFNPITLQIKGMSDGEISMDFPFVETDIDYHSFENLGIKKNENDSFELIVVKGTLD